jgi:hypothetical protein
VKIAPEFLDSIRELIAGARTTVARGVDLVQVHTNLEIGRRIVEEEQRGKDRAAYGKEVVKELANRLTGEFGQGFSKSNLEYMRRFYLAYPNPGFADCPDTVWAIRCPVNYPDSVWAIRRPAKKPDGV